MAETKPTATAAAKPASSVQPAKRVILFPGSPLWLCNYWIFNLEIFNR